MPNRKRPWITLTPQQSTLLCAELEARRPTIALAAHLMIYLGLRLNEARLINESWLHDLGTPAARISIPAEVTKTKHQRDLPIPPKTLSLIQLLTHYHDKQYSLPDIKATPLIRKTTGAHYTPRGLQKAIRLASIKALGFPVRPVALRHTFATQLLRHTNIRVVQIALGHRSLASTQIYTHPQFNDLQQAIERSAAAEMEVKI